MANEIDALPHESDRRKIRDTYVALSIMDEGTLRPPPLSLSDLTAFLSGNQQMSRAQQAFLYANERMLAEFRSLVTGFSVPRLSRGTQPGQRQKASGDIVHLPLRAAAASEDEGPRDRIFPGGSMHVFDFGESQKLLTIRLDQSWAQQPRFLLLEDQDKERLALVDLRNPEPSFDSGINIIRHADNFEHAEQLGILQSSSSVGTFLQ